MKHDFMTELFVAERAVQLAMEKANPPAKLSEEELTMITIKAVSSFMEEAESVNQWLMEMLDWNCGYFEPDYIRKVLCSLVSTQDRITIRDLLHAFGIEADVPKWLTSNVYGWTSLDFTKRCSYLVDSPQKWWLELPELRMLCFISARKEEKRHEIA